MFDSRVRLGGVRLENFDAKSREVDIRIKKDGNIVYDETVSIDSPSDTVSTRIIDCPWDTDAKSAYSVSAKVFDRAEWTELALDKEGGACQWVSVQCENDGIHLDSRNCNDYPETPCDLPAR
ncbi:hypothetical protein C488_06992 [Natrinema pellirubrum DSM 15624]|uniref:Uncharacterized protein n=1 Tax=Natrinema pellirubrum (strain DSM 15624 / CIP 106293 / JCM 10476 / NCIMB 786 / 157) TaxID=797303 RepID=L9YSR0_NATP1|nr:hypothetical protein C488_06992 [Natrinema pellirubrum DSM 15624]